MSATKSPTVYKRLQTADNPHRDKEILEHLYHEAALSLREMAERLGVSPKTVKDWMDKYGIERRDKREAYNLKQIQKGEGITVNSDSDDSGKTWSFQR